MARHRFPRRTVSLALTAGSLAAGARFIASCASPQTGSSPGPAGRIDAARLYLTCAGSCHRPEPVKNYSAADWARILPDMAEEARLSPEKTEALRSWIAQQLAAR